MSDSHNNHHGDSGHGGSHHAATEHSPDSLKNGFIDGFAKIMSIFDGPATFFHG